MDIKNNILETIGKTPLIKLNHVCYQVPAMVLAKVESFNPGNSIKDRVGLKMIEDAEKAGLLKPGGTVIECTSGNTGLGIALACVIKGYKCIFTISDKQSKEKRDILKALGAEVVICPNDVDPEDPKSYYSVAEQLSKEIPNSFWCNQYDNLSNSQAHYESTGPEIWAQTHGKITHLIAPTGTGGTICGTARFLKEQNPNIKVWGIDSYGSVFKKYKETGIFDKNEIYPYLLEGVGEDILPENVNFDLIDHFEKVTDKDAAIMARRLAKEEGLFQGYSTGAAVQGLVQMKDQLTEDDIVVVIMHDHGSRYTGKIYNDDWMRDRGFLEYEMKVKDIINKKANEIFISVDIHQNLKDILKVMKESDISQLPVLKNGLMVGSVIESKVLEHILSNPSRDVYVGEIMDQPFVEVSMDLPVKELNKYISKNMTAVTALDNSGKRHIITQYDIIQAL